MTLLTLVSNHGLNSLGLREAGRKPQRGGSNNLGLPPPHRAELDSRLAAALPVIFPAASAVLSFSSVDTSGLLHIL